MRYVTLCAVRSDVCCVMCAALCASVRVAAPCVLRAVPCAACCALMLLLLLPSLLLLLLHAVAAAAVPCQCVATRAVSLRAISLLLLSVRGHLLRHAACGMLLLPPPPLLPLLRRCRPRSAPLPTQVQGDTFTRADVRRIRQAAATEFKHLPPEQQAAYDNSDPVAEHLDEATPSTAWNVDGLALWGLSTKEAVVETYRVDALVAAQVGKGAGAGKYMSHFRKKFTERTFIQDAGAAPHASTH